MSMNIYVASSWHNVKQQEVVELLRAAGHEVYDFKHPAEENNGFSWLDIDSNYEYWSCEEYRQALENPDAVRGFGLDFAAMQKADVGVLVLPCNRSAHLEAGYFVGARKPLYILLLDRQAPELMYKMATKICLSCDELVEELDTIDLSPSDGCRGADTGLCENCQSTPKPAGDDSIEDISALLETVRRRHFEDILRTFNKSTRDKGEAFVWEKHRQKDPACPMCALIAWVESEVIKKDLITQRFFVDNFERTVLASRVPTQWAYDQACAALHKHEATEKSLRETAQDLLTLIDNVPIEPSLGDETDRVFSRAEFIPLRTALLAHEAPKDEWNMTDAAEIAAYYLGAPQGTNLMVSLKNDIQHAIDSALAEERAEKGGRI